MYGGEIEEIIKDYGGSRLGEPLPLPVRWIRVNIREDVREIEHRKFERDDFTNEDVNKKSCVWEKFRD